METAVVSNSIGLLIDEMLHESDVIATNGDDIGIKRSLMDTSLWDLH